jgi:hypothetical protein
MQTRDMLTDLRCVLTDTILITPMPAHHMASMVRSGLREECLSVQAPGITGGGDTADTMVGPATTDTATMAAASSADETTTGVMGAAAMGADTPVITPAEVTPAATLEAVDSMAEAKREAAVASTEAAVTVADAGNGL